MTPSTRLLKYAGLFLVGIVVLTALKLKPALDSASVADDPVVTIQTAETVTRISEAEFLNAEFPPTIQPAGDGAESDPSIGSSSQPRTSIGESITSQANRARETRSAGIPLFPRDIPTIPALPGVGGFEVQVCLLGVFTERSCDRSAAQVLAEEQDDPTWSRSMENRILSEAARLAPKETTQLNAVCRQTVCGVVIGHLVMDPFTVGNDEESPSDGFFSVGEVRDVMSEPLAEALGLELFGSSVKRTFTALYYRRADRLQEADVSTP